MYRQKKSNLYARASEASERLRNIYFQVSKYICTYTMQFPFITYGIALYRQYNDKILTMSMRVSELRQFLHFHILKQLYFLLYSVGILLILCFRNIYIFRSQITPAGSFLGLSRIEGLWERDGNGVGVGTGTPFRDNRGALLLCSGLPKVSMYTVY